MTWMQTHSGRAVSFLTPDPDQIEIEDICWHLPRIPRFNGATSRFTYSVGQHSLFCCQYMRDTTPNDPAAILAALMHDFHEYATGDRSTPLKKAEELMLPTGWTPPIRIIQDRLDRAIARRFGIDWADVEAVKTLVKRVDLIALSTEKAQLMVKEPIPWDLVDLPPPSEIELLPNSPANVEWLLRNEFERSLAAYQRSKDTKMIAAE